MNSASSISAARATCAPASDQCFGSFGASVARKRAALAAVPGTSNHGWGLAVDLCGGIERFGTAQYAWMVANAGRFGFLHPTWADPGRGREEPWHWEYAGT